jgi:cytochrome c-type biogenesis protein CcmH/NrfG
MRIILSLLGGMLYLCGILSAQHPDDPATQERATDPVVARQRAMEIDHDPDHGPYVPLAEAEWKRMSTSADRTNTTTFPIPEAPKPDQVLPTGTISVHEMQHPVSSKSRKILEKAEGQIRNHDDDAAAATLESALKLEDARPQALAMSGAMQLTAYIRTNNPKILSGSLAALMEASQTLSEDPSVLSNLGMAFYFAGEPERAFAAASKSLQYDPSRAKTRYVLGLVLAWQQKYSEATYHLKLAAGEMPAANDLLKRVERLALESPTVAQK